MRLGNIILSCLCLLAMLPAQLSAQGGRMRNPLQRTDEAFFKTEEARRVGDQILLWQRNTGGWPKNIDMARPLSESERAAVLADKTRIDDSTIDNNATYMQMLYLARLYRGTGDKKYKEAFGKGLEYLMSGQYENGGWPQFWPVQANGYAVNITFNDDAMANTLRLFRDIADEAEPFTGDLTGKAVKKKLRKAFDKGIECILACQIFVDGKPTVWCQQHDPVTLAPAHARAYELPSYCSSESVGLVELLMDLPDPSDRVKQAVHGAMKWFDTYKLTGVRYVRDVEHSRLEEDPGATVPVWARFYDLEYCEPYVCDRDGLPRRHLEQIGRERRNGYGWYNSRAAGIYEKYGAWADKWDPAGKVAVSLTTKGANEKGLIQMYREPKHVKEDFDVIVSPGESIQAAIEKAPANPTEPFKILVLKGLYEQRVVVDRPNIVLVGESKDETVIKFPARMGPGPGVIYFNKGADDCVLSGFTLYNDYGVSVEGTTAHQMTVCGKGDRIIIINCNVWSAGNDTIALWPEGGGMSYLADLDIRSLGVDFLCPRGWCYVTRCRFTGAGHAILWHDGRGDKNKKLVVKNSDFDAILPTPLGRHHHDAAFYLLNCRLSENILDQNIGHSYEIVEIDGVKKIHIVNEKTIYDDLSKFDPGQWGERAYFERTVREGGDSGWLRNNLDEMEHPLASYSMTAEWTFDGKWDPEKVLRDLGRIVAY